jgi:RNA polymerase sigma factor (sigma-70 family)
MALRTYEGRSTLKGWLWTTAMNFAKSYRPRLPPNGTRATMDEETAERPLPAGDEDGENKCVPLPEESLLAGGSVVDEVERNECRELLAGLLQKALDRLPSLDRLILFLRYVEDLTFVDIGTHLNIHPGTVCRRTADALGQLHDTLLVVGEESGRGRGVSECLQLYQQDGNWPYFVALLCDALRQMGRDNPQDAEHKEELKEDER